MKGAGIARSTVAVAAAGAMVWAASRADGSVDSTRPADDNSVSAARSVDAARRTTLTCTGPDQRGAAGSDGTTQKTEVTTAAAPQQLVGSATGGSAKLRIGSSAARTFSLQPAGVRSAWISTAAGATVLADRGLSVGLTATQTTRDDADDGSGLAISPCTGTTTDSWLFGGGAAKGRLARLVLVNPGSTAVTVNAAVVGSSGTDRTKSASDVVVGPGERQVLVLGAFPDSLAQPAVHVTASGGGIAASLTDVDMAGETTRGESTSTPVTSSSRELRIPAVTATDADPVVRVAVPGTSDAIVRVRATSADGEVVVDEVRTVRAGRVAAMALTGLAKGSYAVRVTADEPVSAAALSRTADSGTADLDWASAVPAISGFGSVALPSSVPDRSSTLTLLATRSTSVRVWTRTDGDVTQRTVRVSADRPVSTSVGQASAVWVDPGQDSVYAAVTMTGKGSGPLLSSVPVLPASTTAGAVDVSPSRD